MMRALKQQLKQQPAVQFFKMFFGLAIGIAAVNGILFAEAVDASSKIAEVVVFQDRALVTRRAELRLTKGMHEVKFSPLPGTIEADSVGAKGSGEAKVKLFGAKLLTRQLEGAQEPRIKEIREAIEKLEDRKRALEDAKKALRAKEAFLTSIQAASSDQIGKDIVTKLPSVPETEGLVSFIGDGLLAAYRGMLESDIELRRIGEEMDRLARELNQFDAVTKQENSIVVDLEAETAGLFTLNVSYRLPGASWAPVYEARAESGNQSVQLASYGFVRQGTGENWEDVSLSLSTAKPAAGGRMPEIAPWFLRKLEPLMPSLPPGYVRAKVDDRLTGKGGELTEDFDSVTYEKSTKAERTPPAEAHVAQAVIEARGPAVRFTLPKHETISSDWQPKKVSILTQNLPASFAYDTTPRLSPQVYLRAKVTNHSDGVLLSGPVQIFLDGAYLGASSIDLIGPEEEFNLYLGADERIRVERKQLQAKTDVSLLPDFRGRAKTVRYEYLTTVENFTNEPASITLFDQIPVSEHDEIKIEQVKFEPAPTEKDEEKPGVHVWKFSVPPGGKQAIKLAFRLKHPDHFMIEGM